MIHDVFISYASEDREVAERVCVQLEAQGIGCWMAPRDIRPGDVYSGAIINAIDHSRALVLIFSSFSNESPHVLQEVGRAVTGSIAVFPFRIQDVPVSRNMGHYLGIPVWTDGFNPPLEKQINRFVDRVKMLLEGRDISPESSAFVFNRNFLRFQVSIRVVAAIFILTVISTTFGSMFFHSLTQNEPEIWFEQRALWDQNKDGSLVVVTGNTTLPEGSNILYSYAPLSFTWEEAMKNELDVNPLCGMGITEVGVYQKSKFRLIDNINPPSNIFVIYFPITTFNMESGDYIVHVAPITDDQKNLIYRDIRNGSTEYSWRLLYSTNENVYEKTFFVIKTTYDLEELFPSPPDMPITYEGNISP